MAKKQDRPAELSRLHAALSGMDLPDHKKRPTTNESLRWLSRSMGERNAGHPSYQEACGCLDRLGWPVRDA